MADPIYKERTQTYTETMEIYEHMDIPEEIRTAVHNYIIALEMLNQRCEYACYLAGVIDSTTVADYLNTKRGN